MRGFSDPECKNYTIKGQLEKHFENGASFHSCVFDYNEYGIDLTRVVVV